MCQHRESADSGLDRVLVGRLTVQSGTNEIPKRGTVSASNMLLVINRCCCYYGHIHWEKSSDWKVWDWERESDNHTLRRSSSLSSSSRFLLAVVLLPWWKPDERGFLLFLFLSDSSRRPTRSSSLSSWNQQLLWHICGRRQNTADAKGEAHLEEGAALGRRVPGGSGGFDHSHPGDAQHLVLTVVVLLIQRERTQAVRVHRLGRDVTVGVVAPAPLSGWGRGGLRGFELFHQPLHLLFTPLFVHVDLRTRSIQMIQTSLWEIIHRRRSKPNIL